MKKLMYLLLAVPMFFFASCSDDKDDLPQVDMSIDYSGAVSVNGELYAVQGDTIYFNSISVTPVREGKKAAIVSVSYYWDGWLMGVVPQPPFSASIAVTGNKVGKHLLSLQMPLVEDGCEAATAYTSYTVNVVASKDEIPNVGDNSNDGSSSSIDTRRPTIQ